MKLLYTFLLISSLFVSSAIVQPDLTSSYVVNSTLDLPDGDTADNACATSPPGTPVCTLRAAVMQANAHQGQDYIIIPAGTYVLTRSGYDATAVLGDLDVTDDLTIMTSGTPVVIDANGGVIFDRLFEVISGSLKLQDLTIANGNTPSYGGAIYSQGSLWLSNVRVINNTAALDGGGIYNSGPATKIESSSFKGNKTSKSGGGINVYGNGITIPTFSLTSSEVIDNQADSVNGSGGGIYIRMASSAIQKSTFRRNSSSQGGGLGYTSANLTLPLNITDSLFDSNVATSGGGGMALFGDSTITNIQVVSNTASSSAGILVYFGTLILDYARISHNTATTYMCGGISINNGSLYLSRSWIEKNVAAQGYGGGICAVSGDVSTLVSISDTNIFNNQSLDGGGIFTYNKKTIIRKSAIFNNSASTGGGISTASYTILENTTISGNSARSHGGGIYAIASANLRMNSLSLVSNSARTGYPGPGTGGGIYILSPASAIAASTLIALNTNSTLFASPSDCFGTLSSDRYNFIGSNAGCTITGNPTGNQVGGAFPSNIVPLVSSLLWLTGLTPGHLPLAGSPLINAGPPVGCQAADGSFLFVDQIDHFRSLDGRCDIGAVESFNWAPIFLPLIRK